MLAAFSTVVCRTDNLQRSGITTEPQKIGRLCWPTSEGRGQKTLAVCIRREVVSILVVSPLLVRILNRSEDPSRRAATIDKRLGSKSTSTTTELIRIWVLGQGPQRVNRLPGRLHATM